LNTRAPSAPRPIDPRNVAPKPAPYVHTPAVMPPPPPALPHSVRWLLPHFDAASNRISARLLFESESGWDSQELPHHRRGVTVSD
jgi:hypothetical protein